jgi:hypothetical protein
LKLASIGSLALVAIGCAARPPEHIVGTPMGRVTAVSVSAEDPTPKAEFRMVPPEVYMRTYLQLFGGLTPVDVQKAARSTDGAQLFDTWDDYVSALGLPDYGLDIPRQQQTNALMVATFERLGIALCDRAVLHDLAMLDLQAPKPKAAPPKPGPEIVPLHQRVIFAFEPKAGAMNQAEFDSRFDVLHRTFLGYPASLAPPERAPRFFALYSEMVGHHAESAPKSKLSPAQAGWAAVCYGLVRHPEFHLY